MSRYRSIILLSDVNRVGKHAYKTP